LTDRVVNRTEYAAACTYRQNDGTMPARNSMRATKFEQTAHASQSYRATQPTGWPSPPPDFSNSKFPLVSNRPPRSRVETFRMVGGN
jgi:hypothetical protein